MSLENIGQNLFMIKQGQKVTLEYSIFDNENKLLDSSRGLGPLNITLGDKQIWPALEAAIAQMTKGETQKVEVASADAFGAVVETAFKEVELSMLPEDSREPNAILGFTDEKGEQHQVKVHAINGDKATLDFNHPLAGQDVIFELHVIDVED